LIIRIIQDEEEERVRTIVGTQMLIRFALLVDVGQALADEIVPELRDDHAAAKNCSSTETGGGVGWWSSWSPPGGGGGGASAAA